MKNFMTFIKRFCCNLVSFKIIDVKIIFGSLLIMLISVASIAAPVSPASVGTITDKSQKWMNIHCASTTPPLGIEGHVSVNLFKLKTTDYKNIKTGGENADINYWITLNKKDIFFKQIGISYRSGNVLYRGDNDGFFFVLLINNEDMIESIGLDKFFIGKIFIGQLDHLGNPIINNEVRKSDMICYFNYSNNNY